MEILIRHIAGDNEPQHLKSKSELTADKVFNVLVEEKLYFGTLQEFEEKIWSLLLQDIIVHTPNLLCTLTPLLPPKD